MTEPAGFRDGLVLLHERDFSRLFAAYLVSYFGTAMAPIAIAFGVLELTGSTSDSAIVIAASTTGQILILLIGGTLADRTSRHRLIICADSLGCCSQLLMGYLFLAGQASVTSLAILMLVTGIAYALHQPAITGFIPQMVNRDKLQAANALMGTARNGSLTSASVPLLQDLPGRYLVCSGTPPCRLTYRHTCCHGSAPTITWVPSVWHHWALSSSASCTRQSATGIHCCSAPPA